MEQFRFPGPGGISWTHRVQTLGVAQSIPLDVPYRDDRSYRESIGAAAGAEIGRRILADAAARSERTDTRSGRIELEWRVSVVMPDTGKNWFAEQIERERHEARRAALQEAAEICRATGARYASKDGMCAGVLASAMGDAARSIQDIAERPQKNKWV